MNRFLESLCALALLGSTTLAQSANAPGTIAGHVFRDDTGAPLSNVLVTLMQDSDSGSVNDRRARTNADGGFIFRDVEPGDYNVRAEKTGYLPAEYNDVGQDGEDDDSLTVESGANVKGIAVRIRQSAVISGIVADEGGDPVQGVRVVAICPRYEPHGMQSYYFPATTYTNDLGQYRLAGLEPGDYYVGTGSGTEIGYMHLPHNVQYIGVFYPNAEEIDDAQRIRLASGAEVSGINFAVRTSLKSYTIRGTVSGAQVGYPGNTSVQMRHESLGGIATIGDPQAFVNVGKNGSFSFPSVPPGTYEIEAQYFQRGSSDTKTQDSLQLGVATVHVTDADVSVHIAILPPSVIRGSARFQNGGGPAIQNLGMVLISADRRASVENSSVDEQGRFAFVNAAPGSYYFSVNGAARTYVSRVECNGADYTERPVLVSPEESELDCELTIATDGVDLAGKVMNEDRPLRGYVVVAFSESKTSRQLPDGISLSVPSNKKGEFQLRSLRPGDYLLFAVPEDPEWSYFAPDFADRNSENGTTVTIKPGESQNVTLHPTKPQ